MENDKTILIYVDRQRAKNSQNGTEKRRQNLGDVGGGNKAMTRTNFCKSPSSRSVSDTSHI